MGDAPPLKPDHACLFARASEQQGYFTTGQARECGFSNALLASHARSGRFVRVRRGLYRLRDYPSSPREEVMAAWLALGKDTTVVSHESALDLLGLGDIIPDAVHLLAPRSRRNLPDLPGVVVHTTTRPLGPADVTVREGIRLTSAGRSILDTAAAGAAPEQIEAAIRQALARGLVTRAQLEADASERGRRVAALIDRALVEGMRAIARGSSSRLLDPSTPRLV